LPRDTDSIYPRPKSGPSENAKAVWAVLQQNYPNAFKKVDLNDPGGVWAANLDDLTTRQMQDGLPALQRHDDRYMPNAPTCRKIIVEASEAEQQRVPLPPEPEIDPIEFMFKRLRGYVWMRYVKTMVLKRNAEITGDQAHACYHAALRVCQPYEDAWRTEPDKGEEMWGGMSRATVKALLAAWNEITRPVHPCTAYEELYPPE